MSNPRNPLDHFVSYTYHFELHAAATTAELHRIGINEDKNLSTTARHATDTLLINTRKDAHQTIDNVRFSYVCASGNTGAIHTALSMNVIEPGGMFFPQKIKEIKDKHNMMNETLVFGLKIFFVGQLPDKRDYTEKIGSIIIMRVLTMTGDFEYTGSKYSLTFQPAGLDPYADYSDVYKNWIDYNISYINKSISISSKSVKEAISLLELKLNNNYKKTYETSAKNDIGAKTLKYILKLDSRLDGTINTTNKSSTASNAEDMFTFDTSKTIQNMIQTILLSSKDITDLLSSSKNGILKALHPNVHLINIVPLLNQTEDTVEIIYHIVLYEGNNNTTYEFDYYFSEPGRNVDIINFSTSFTNLYYGFIESNIISSDLLLNLNSNSPKNNPLTYSSNTVTQDVIKNQLENIDIPRNNTLTGKSGDVAWLPMVARSDAAGKIATDYLAVNSSRLAGNIDLLASAGGKDYIFTMRGNLDLLNRCIILPNEELILSDNGTGAANGFGISGGLWIKVNMYSLDENKERIPFWYTDWYLCNTIENVFENGTFIQIVKLIAMSFDEKEDTNNPNTSPGSNRKDADDSEINRENKKFNDGALGDIQKRNERERTRGKFGTLSGNVPRSAFKAPKL